MGVLSVGAAVSYYSPQVCRGVRDLQDSNGHDLGDLVVKAGKVKGYVAVLRASFWS